MLKLTFVLFLAAGLTSSVYSQASRAFPQSIQMTDGFSDGNVTFSIDTPSVTYKPYKGKGITLSNSSSGFKIFAYFVLLSDPAEEMKLAVDTSAVKVDTVELKSGKPVSFNFTLTTTLKPTGTQKTFPSGAEAHLLTQFGGAYIPFAMDTVKFTATFPAYSSSGVLPEIADNISLNINPNPISRFATFHVTASEGELVTVELYDMLGNRKALLVNGEYFNGARDFRFDASAFGAGMYFARLLIRGKIITKKIVIQ